MTRLRELMNPWMLKDQTDRMAMDELAGRFWSVLEAWWRGLEDDRGTRAVLRRAKTPLAVFITPEFQRGPVALLTRNGIDLDHQDQERLALGLGVLAHVAPPVKDRTEGAPPHFAGLLKPEKGQESTRDPRMRKLLTLEDQESEALFLMLRRLAKYLEGKAPVGAAWRSLLRGACFWDEKTRRGWAMDYYVHREKPGK
ncbi:hypothetical protein NNJEOMEG_01134 [Fundidesulfovibrio magnetotacticus]|uniref:Type I-E CRISPR-associated protein Cse2/CasB n=1 Tax=Fundidesulfovibrio magnetotacticus TaxID=2730080 RepID=A0A6V8LKT1_9BACT|nr:type I-E CRISPR-associated protein Cse2/CasB [Fundidesulfovibrio magnetotacticus]GFK93303.1 hypothetical protein NNJEOMEG_01134 [Fundidesulfovibrio magnetotacticus]